MVQILIVEDDRDVAQVLQVMVQRGDYQTHVAYDGVSAQVLIEAHSFDVAILDLNLGQGEMSGIDLLASLRDVSPQTAVIMLSGYATLDSAISAVRLGAHDYLLKPANMTQVRHSIEQALQKQAKADKKQTLLNELEQQLSHSLADVRQMLGEETAVGHPPAITEARFVEYGNLIIDLTRQIVLIDQQPLDLTLIEYSLLTYLIHSAPRLITPQELVAQIHGHDADYDEASNLIRPHISRLRRKLNRYTTAEIVVTVRGRGYMVDKLNVKRTT